MDFSLVTSALLTALGESVTYRPISGLVEEFTVSVVWSMDQSAKDVNSAAAAAALIRLSDFSVAPKKGDELIRDGKVYRVAENPEDRKDGAGGCTLILRYVKEEA